ncbi:hypothetical protein [Streptomyces sp. SID5606]|uniref:hypothetical protein n=1 Tax=Streptomyces sp. SID5606 TaxID=2690305 RepID=UPI001F43EE37|nr:hypothetical protein [Streptomyces sp. SID5606]
MTAWGPDRGDAPDGPEGAPGVPEHVWRMFLEDDERAIRATAPREPAARDRIPGLPPAPPATGPGAAAEPLGVRPGPFAGTVGEPWRPEEPRPAPAWRGLDRRARLRRAGRVFGTAATVALALTAWSQLATGPATPGRAPADTIGRPLDDSPVLPTLASPAPTRSGTASPAAFDSAPSAIPRVSESAAAFASASASASASARIG